MPGGGSLLSEHPILEALRDLSLEEGRIYIQEHRAEFTDVADIGMLLATEAIRQRDIHPFTALKLAEQLIFFGEQMQHDESCALGLMRKGDALSAIGHEQAAMGAFDAASDEFQRLGDEFNQARTRIGWIISCAWLGRVGEALQTAAQARSVFERLSLPYWQCIIDHNTAVIYTQIGQYQKALEIYDRMLAVYATLTDMEQPQIQRVVAMVEMNQARNLAWLGSFEQASRLLQAAHQTFVALGLLELAIRTERDLAEFDYIQGHYGSALRKYYQIRDSFMQNKFAGEPLAAMKLRIAECLVKLSRIQEAYMFASEAREIYQRIYQNQGKTLTAGDKILEYANVIGTAGKLKESIAALEEAGEIFERGGFIHHVTATKLQKAELLLRLEDFASAFEQASQLKQYFDRYGLVARSTDASLIMVGALVLQIRKRDSMQVRQQTELFAKAYSFCKQITMAAEQYKLREQAYRSEYFLGQLANLQEDVEGSKQHFASAIEKVEKILYNLAYDLRPAFLQSTWMIYEDVIALCLQRQPDEAFSYLERARSLALRQYLEKEEPQSIQAQNATLLRLKSELNQWQGRYRSYSSLLSELDMSVSADVNREVIQREVQQCEQKIKELFERLHLLQVVDDGVRQEELAIEVNREINATELRRYLEPGQLLLAYFLYHGKLVIFALTRDQFITHEIVGGMAQLERLLPPLYAHLEPKGWPDPQHPPQQIIRRLLHKLYDLLIAPVAEMLSGANILTIVPYGPLHSLPFHALYSGERFLIEDFQVNYLPASSILLHLAEQSKVATPSNKSPLIFGYSGDGELPRVLMEAQSVAELVSGECFLEEEATVTELLEAAEGSPLIHLATHGHCRLDAPNFSYIQLADGQLNAIDAFGLNLEGCELVTLSGCETGLALIGGGDEQLGLGRAFLAAGASSLVMSLWPVEDHSTNELMQLFYERLLQGDSKVEALRAAQQHLLHHNKASYAHPYFWAAFRLVGEVGPLRSLK